MQLHNVQRHTKRKHGIKVGRGGKRGKTSGRGTKGQKARSGHKMRPEIRDIIKRIPKLRGRGINSFKSLVPNAVVINLSTLSLRFPNGGEVSPKTLTEARLVRASTSRIKILATGEAKAAFVVTGCEASESAKKKIIAAGGSIK